MRRLKQEYWGALPEQLDTNLRLLAQQQLEQQTLGENLRTLEDRRTSLERALVELRQAVRKDPSVDTDARSQLLKLQAQYAALRERYTEEFPDVRALRLRIDRLEQQLAHPAPEPPAPRSDTDPQVLALDQSLQKVEAEIGAVNARREELDRRIQDLHARVEKTPGVEQALTDVTRDYQQLRENYLALLRKDNDARMAKKMEEHWQGNYFRILDPAQAPDRPIRPYGALFAMGGLVAGLMAGLAFALAADFLDHSVKSLRELDTLVPAPVLVVIPRLRSARWRLSS
jgi:uncharacterized protein involved in exopolysaccharide biosynthesis